MISLASTSDIIIDSLLKLFSLIFTPYNVYYQSKSVMQTYFHWILSWPYIDIRKVWCKHIFVEFYHDIIFTFEKRDASIFSLISNMMLYWRHWCHFDKSTINILSLICFVRNGLLTFQALPSMRYCSDKFILAQQIKESILYICIAVKFSNTGNNFCVFHGYTIHWTHNN